MVMQLDHEIEEKITVSYPGKKWPSSRTDTGDASRGPTHVSGQRAHGGHRGGRGPEGGSEAPEGHPGAVGHGRGDLLPGPALRWGRRPSARPARR